MKEGRVLDQKALLLSHPSREMAQMDSLAFRLDSNQARMDSHHEEMMAIMKAPLGKRCQDGERPGMNCSQN
jgi:hypothetical protein